MPGTLVTFHAHPDDEAIATGGAMARAAAEGHRVVLVVATKGELAGIGREMLAPGETMAERRVVETQAAAEILGVARVEFLGYRDSGMEGEPTNDDPDSFWSADVEEAATQLARILTEEDAEVLTVYDTHGVYGHPDHVQVHRVGVRAAEVAGTPRVYESTLNRDFIVRMMGEHRAEVQEHVNEVPDIDSFDMGVSEEEITTALDVRDYADIKRKAMAAHASQIAESSFFLSLPPHLFRESFGREWYIHRGEPPGIHEDTLFPA
ncbi:MAG: PIG-L family deacetylase [Acidimicrobiia bacterium]